MNINETFAIYFTEISNIKRLKEIQDLIKNRKISYFEAEEMHEKEDLRKYDVVFIKVNINYNSINGLMNVDININDELLKYGIDELEDMKNQVIKFIRNTIMPNLEKCKSMGITRNTTYEIKAYLKELDYIVKYMFKMQNLKTEMQSN